MPRKILIEIRPSSKRKETARNSPNSRKKVRLPVSKGFEEEEEEISDEENDERSLEEDDEEASEDDEASQEEEDEDEVDEEEEEEESEETSDLEEEQLESNSDEEEEEEESDSEEETVEDEVLDAAATPKAKRAEKNNLRRSKRSAEKAEREGRKVYSLKTQTIIPTPTQVNITTPSRSNKKLVQGSTRAGAMSKKEAGKPHFNVGADVICKCSVDNQDHPAKILQSRTKSSSSSVNLKETEYYVRYSGLDHRLDEWVPSSRVKDISPSFHKKVEDTDCSSRSPSPRSVIDEESHQVKNINSIQLGKYEIETWYYSPFPDEYCQEPTLYLCEFCLKYMKRRHTLERHAEKCDLRHPPGIEIYREGELSVFEVDGKKQRVYCQNLCLVSKLFLDHKTLYYDVDPFYFYVLTECDSKGAHIVGYFSKEKYSPDCFNLACIMTLPPFQRKGYGSLLISLSYELSKREGVAGSPEKPLSDLGRLGYQSYWSRVILTLLRENKSKDLSIRDISRMTAIHIDDIVDTLKELKLIRYSKGKHLLLISQKLINSYLDSTSGKKFRVVNPQLVSWQPHKLGKATIDSRHL